MTMPGFTSFPFSFEGVERTVHRRGDGPAVVIMHEIPGITPEVKRFAEIVADAGFAVYLPQLFGTPEKPLSPGYAAAQIGLACVRREFAVLARHESSPITEWLRALCRLAFTERGGRGVGALGMCLTGNLALALMVDDHLMAPVLSQPSLPFAPPHGLPFGESYRAAVHATPEQMEVARRRSAAGCPVLGLRFTHDPMCPPERFETLRRELGAGFEGIEIDSGPGNPHGIGRMAHSVLTLELRDDPDHPTRRALERVLAFFAQQLR